ncbi:hypothetical protein BDAP_001871 [Binucleata daphniae]
MQLNELLLDYGITIKNVYENIKNNTELKELTKLYNAKTLAECMAVLIQKRFVECKKINEKTYYMPNNQNLQRRLYFPLYINFVMGKYGKEIGNLFEKILLCGIYNKSTANKMLMIKLLDSKIVVNYENTYNENNTMQITKDAKNMQQNNNIENIKKLKIDKKNNISEITNDFVIVNYTK